MSKKPKRANLKGPGTCIFCNERGLTHEHMYADWLRDYIPRTMTEHRTRSALVHLDKEEASIQRRTGDPHSRRIRCVCEPCNNEWMSQLQEDVKPFLVPMLKGEKTSLRLRGQTVLAAWITMTVMVAEHVDRRMVAVPSSDRHYLREHRKAPLHWRIWIGRHQAETHPLFTHNVLPFAPKEEVEALAIPVTDRAANTQTTTICVGNLLIHVMSSVVAHSIIRRWRLPLPVRAGMAQIWPVRTPVVPWPSGLTLTDAGIDLLAQEFANKARALLRSLYPTYS
jgi:hypothetical protein